MSVNAIVFTLSQTSVSWHTAVLRALGKNCATDIRVHLRTAFVYFVTGRWQQQQPLQDSNIRSNGCCFTLSFAGWMCAATISLFLHILFCFHKGLTLILFCYFFVLSFGNIYAAFLLFCLRCCYVWCCATSDGSRKRKQLLITITWKINKTRLTLRQKKCVEVRGYLCL